MSVTIDPYHYDDSGDDLDFPVLPTREEWADLQAMRDEARAANGYPPDPLPQYDEMLRQAAIAGIEIPDSADTSTKAFVKDFREEDWVRSSGGQFQAFVGGGSGGAGAGAAGAVSPSSLQKQLPANGGFTVHTMTGVTPPNGWMVSLPGHETIIPKAQLNAQALHDYIATNKEALTPPDHYLGGWYDKANGQVFLDVSQNVQSQEDAVKLMDERNQYEINNIGTGEELTREQAGLAPTHRGVNHVGRKDSTLHVMFLDPNNIEASLAAFQAMVAQVKDQQ